MIEIRSATRQDVPLLREFICALAEYERLGHECFATEEKLSQSLFGDKPAAEALLAFYNGEPAGFALFFHNYSTFLAQPGLYLEDLFVKPELRRRGIGQALFRRLGRGVCGRRCGPFLWAAVGWDPPEVLFFLRLGGKEVCG